MEPELTANSESRTWLVEGVETGSHRVSEKAEVPGPGPLPVEPLRTGRGGDSGSQWSTGGKFQRRNLAGLGKQNMFFSQSVLSHFHVKGQSPQGARERVGEEWLHFLPAPFPASSLDSQD